MDRGPLLFEREEAQYLIDLITQDNKVALNGIEQAGVGKDDIQRLKKWIKIADIAFHEIVTNQRLTNSGFVSTIRSC